MAVVSDSCGVFAALPAAAVALWGGTTRLLVCSARASWKCRRDRLGVRVVLSNERSTVFMQSIPIYWTEMANENVSPAVMQRLLKEVAQYTKSPVEGMLLRVNEENVTDIVVDFEGPEGTPYENGLFHIKLVFGSDFPAAPPKGTFVSQIFHPNISKTGEICVNTLKRDWKPEHSLSHILSVIRCLLIEPNPESALNEEAGKLLLEEFETFASRARLMTEIHSLNPKKAAVKAAAAAAVDAEAESGSSASSPKKDAKKLEKKKSLKRL